MRPRAEKIELLWRYANNDCSANEQRMVEAWLNTDPQLQAEWQDISHLNQQLQQQASADEPSLRFKTNVMEQLAVEPQPEGLVSRRIKFWLGLFFIVFTLLAAIDASFLAGIQIWPEEWPVAWEGTFTSWTKYLFDLKLGTHWVVFAAMLMPLLLDQYLLKLLNKHRQKLEQRKG